MNSSINNIKPGGTTAWLHKWIKIGDETLSLNEIENNKLRKPYKDARIHFVINCASFSCPRLRNEAFTAERLNEQLGDQMKGFINNKTKNKLDPDNPKMSKLFKWYRGDFKDTGKSVWQNDTLKIKF